MLHTWELTIPHLAPRLRRRAYLYLPKAYDEDPNARFPVLYMFDGQNIFLDSEASFGRSWRLYDYMNVTETPLIIAAVESNPVGNGRLCEYAPFSYTDPQAGPITGRARTMMNWIVREFKPQIDSQFRTLPDREHTMIAGSSMGGLITLYAALQYSETFSRAACLSPSLWTDPGKVRKMIRQAPVRSDSMIYMDYGEQEMGNHEETASIFFSAAQALYARGVNLTFRVVPGGTHSEESWDSRTPVFMSCLTD